MEVEAPRAPRPDYELVHKTRWEKEKLAAGDEHAFDNPNDPSYLGNWHLGETVGKGASGKLFRYPDTGMDVLKDARPRPRQNCKA